jgi:hypothetical protein
MHQGSKSPQIQQHISVNENVVCPIFFTLLLQINIGNAAKLCIFVSIFS